MSGKTKRNFGKPSNVKTNIASVMEYKNQLTQYTYAIIPKGDSVTEVFYNSSHSFGPEELHLFSLLKF